MLRAGGRPARIVAGWLVLLPILLSSLLAAEQRRLVLWVPVGVAAGAWGYFALPVEPGLAGGVLGPLGMSCGAVMAALWFRHRLGVRVIAGGCVSLAAGFLLAAQTTHRQPPMPELPRRAVEISGVARAITHAAPVVAGSPDIRWLELGAPVFHTYLTEDMQPLPRTLRLRLREGDTTPITPGARLRVRAVLRPPPDPALPGGRDPQFEAWFSGLAGSGMLLAPVKIEATQETGSEAEAAGGIPSPGLAPWTFAARWSTWLEGLRTRMDTRIRAVLPGDSGAVASTLLDGKSESIAPAVREDFAASGLAHLLAVAGLHLGLVMAVVMGVCRFLLAAWEFAALRWPTKALSALVAWLAGGVYVLLTGAHLPAQRGWLMAGVVVLGLATQRRPVSMRGLALAGFALEAVQPQVVTGVVFQMSMAAVMALIAGYESLQPRLAPWLGRVTGVWGWLLGHVSGLALVSLLAGCATLPVVMAHFGVVEPYFVLANLVAVPLMAVWIMPLGLLAVCCMPVHADAWCLRLMGLGLRCVLWMAHTVAHWPGAKLAVPLMPGWGLAIALLGLCWLCLWRRGWRWLGCVGLVLGMLSPWLAPRPDLLVSPDGDMLGIRGPDAVLVMGQSRDGGAVEKAWAQALGLPVRTVSPQTAFQTPDGALTCGEDGVPGICLLIRHGHEIVLVLHPPPPSEGTGAQADEMAPGNTEGGNAGNTGADGGPLAALCAGADGVVSTARFGLICPTAPLRLDRTATWWQGAQAVFLSGQVRVLAARPYGASRPWMLRPGGHATPLLPLAQAE
ncbi:ComEC/Rec2 family competence protein [Acetobacter sp. TBRC 12305]|uniref:ComEC/Rec2 family competence protein n=1 Tax=Acetobacter garciniae TaxID=2817435 RepID=A0A939KL04_9PROT|nr:ComEC/Rec2 family competence protein [Acetobacter garciniae]MBO1323768.1 ComEC/Rec2 family competence protein [Acetobacter garciniae]MBX0343457.1 ComEC/Rec2 family competence protein [Acetobacter garciniae]